MTRIMLNTTDPGVLGDLHPLSRRSQWEGPAATTACLWFLDEMGWGSCLSPLLTATACGSAGARFLRLVSFLNAPEMPGEMLHFNYQFIFILKIYTHIQYQQKSFKSIAYIIGI